MGVRSCNATWKALPDQRVRRALGAVRLGSTLLWLLALRLSGTGPGFPLTPASCRAVSVGPASSRSLIPNSAIEWSFLRRRRSHMGEGLCLLSGEGILFRVPLAKPDGTLGLPFGSFAFRWRSQAEHLVCLSGPSPLQGLGPRSLTPPLAHSSPGSSPGPNAPNPLAGDCPAMPAMKIHGDLHFHFDFAFHRGIGGMRTGGPFRPSARGRLGRRHSG